MLTSYKKMSKTELAEAAGIATGMAAGMQAVQPKVAETIKNAQTELKKLAGIVTEVEKDNTQHAELLKSFGTCDKCQNFFTESNPACVLTCVHSICKNDMENLTWIVPEKVLIGVCPLCRIARTGLIAPALDLHRDRRGMVISKLAGFGQDIPNKEFRPSTEDFNGVYAKIDELVSRVKEVAGGYEYGRSMKKKSPMKKKSSKRSKSPKRSTRSMKKKSPAKKKKASRRKLLSVRRTRK